MAMDIWRGEIHLDDDSPPLGGKQRGDIVAYLADPMQTSVFKAHVLMLALCYPNTLGLDILR